MSCPPRVLVCFLLWELFLSELNSGTSGLFMPTVLSELLMEWFPWFPFIQRDIKSSPQTRLSKEI